MGDIQKIKDLLRLNDSDIQKSRDFFGKSESDVKQDISIIREWLKQQPHLPDDEDDERLERMLITNKFRLEQTKEKLENCYTFKSKYPDVMEFYDVESELYQKAVQRFYLAPLPKMTKNLERIIFLKEFPMADFKPDYYFAGFLLFELLKTYDSSLKFIYVVDTANVSFDDVTKYNFAFIQKVFHIAINSLCATYSKCIYLNAPTFYDIVMKLLKLVLKPKLFERMSVHTDVESAYKVFPKELLPIEYGGENGSLEKLHNEWQDVVKGNAKFFKKIAERKSKEELRVGDIKANELFGTEGSFKKLNLD